MKNTPKNTPPNPSKATLKAFPKESLTGFREPTREEVRKIAKETGKEEKASRRPKVFWLAFCLLLAVCAILNLAASAGDMMDGELPVTVGMFAASAIAAAMLVGSIRKGKALAGAYVGGKFEVLECMAYRMETAPNIPGESIVFVETADRQRCKDQFLVRTGKKDMRFLMARCGGEYRLFAMAETE